MNLSMILLLFSRICYDYYQPQIRVISKFIRVIPCLKKSGDSAGHTIVVYHIQAKKYRGRK